MDRINIYKRCFLFDFGFTARQDYFNHFDSIQSLGGAKTGVPW